MRSSIPLLLALLLGGADVHADDASKKTTVAILMFDGVQIIDFAAPYEVFGQAGFSVYTVSKAGRAITTAMKLKAGVDYGFDDAPPADIIVVPGGDVHATHDDEATLAWLRTRAGHADHVLSVCTGSYILAATGLLDGKSATTFHSAFDGMAEQFPKVTIVRGQRWVDSGKLVTSAGLASGIDAALHVVAQVRGLTAAKSVAQHLEYDWSPRAGYVRGLMADQFMRLPAGLELPKGTRMDRVSGTGDTRAWELDFAVHSPLSPEALLDYLRDAAGKDPALAVLPRKDARQLAWQYVAQRGGHWRLSFEASDGEAPEQWRLVTKVVALD